uniref:Uncharacterized protein n=1 Tax=Oryza nivara TaxID=4536 RepID=A0A0E0FMH1_ORYNI
MVISRLGSSCAIVSYTHPQPSCSPSSLLCWRIPARQEKRWRRSGAGRRRRTTNQRLGRRVPSSGALTLSRHAPARRETVLKRGKI